MDNLKKKLIDKCKAVQQENIDNLKLVVDEAQKSANDYGAAKDRYDSYRTQMLRKRDMFAQQLQKANEQMDALNMIDPEFKYEKAEFGALIVTDKQKLFISTGLGKIDVDEVEVYAISPLVPIFEALEGKTIGDSFSFRGIESVIKEIL